MATIPRQHHYVPSFYLAGFTADGTSDGRLYVADKQLGKSWPTSPANAAKQRDFHAVDADDPAMRFRVETALSEREGPWRESLVRAVTAGRLTPGKDVNCLLEFIAFMTVRVPRFRALCEDFLGGAQGLLRESSEEQAESGFERLSPTWYVEQMVETATTLAKVLRSRSWCLWHVHEGAPDLVCSDVPVVLSWALPGNYGGPPGFGLAGTFVSVPLNKRVLAVSALQLPLWPRTLPRLEVANMNTMRVCYARQAYSPDSEFVWLSRRGDYCGLTDFLADSPSPTAN